MINIYSESQVASFFLNQNSNDKNIMELNKEIDSTYEKLNTQLNNPKIKSEYMDEDIKKIMLDFKNKVKVMKNIPPQQAEVGLTKTKK